MTARRVCVTPNLLEHYAFQYGTPIEFDHVRNIAVTRVDGVDYWAALDGWEA